MPVGQRESDELWLKERGYLNDALQRAAYRATEALWRRIEPAVWAADDRVSSRILDEDQQRNHQLSRETERTRQRQQWKAQSIKTLAQDPQYRDALLAEARRRGDNEVPEALKQPVPISDMARIYAGFEGSQYRDEKIEPPETFSRLQLKDEPAVVLDDTPRRGGGLTFAKEPQLLAEQAPTRLALQTEKPQPPSASNSDALSLSSLSRKLLPKELWIEQKTNIPSRSYALPARKGTW